MPKTKSQKQKEAETRLNQRAKISHKDQISRLDALFGHGQGSLKERAKLKTRAERSNKPNRKEEETDPNAEVEKPKKKSRKSKSESLS